MAGSGLIVAGENIPAKTRANLVNCTLFAQLAASGEVPESRKVMDWHDAYSRWLAVLGWPSRTDSTFSDYRSPQANVCRDSGNSRIGLPVSATSAFTTAGAIGGSGGSPTPPIASPDSMMMVSMRSGDCVMRSSG